MGKIDLIYSVFSLTSKKEQKPIAKVKMQYPLYPCEEDPNYGTDYGHKSTTSKSDSIVVRVKCGTCRTWKRIFEINGKKGSVVPKAVVDGRTNKKESQITPHNENCILYLIQNKEQITYGDFMKMVKKKEKENNEDSIKNDNQIDEDNPSAEPNLSDSRNEHEIPFEHSLEDRTKSQIGCLFEQNVRRFVLLNDIKNFSVILFDLNNSRKLSQAKHLYLHVDEHLIIDYVVVSISSMESPGKLSPLAFFLYNSVSDLLISKDLFYLVNSTSKYLKFDCKFEKFFVEPYEGLISFLGRFFLNFFQAIFS